MLFVDNQNNTDPCLNLALEEYLLRNARLEEPILLFYVNEPTVVLGRNQNVWEEVDLDYIRENQIHLVRRLSGGGAVYHDLGNLNFSFITSGSEDLHNFAKFTDPVVKALRLLGVAAELRHKSSLFVQDRKISGNAQYMSGGRMVSHGTLLFNTDLEQMLRALNPHRVWIESKAVQSVRSRVMNMQEMLPDGMHVTDLRQALLASIFDAGQIPIMMLTDTDWSQIMTCASERYRTWAWNIGRSPKFTVRKSAETSLGQVNVRIEVEHGMVQAVSLTGPDLMDGTPLSISILQGVRYEREALATALTDEGNTPYLGVFSLEVLLDLLY